MSATSSRVSSLLTDAEYLRASVTLCLCLRSSPDIEVLRGLL